MYSPIICFVETLINKNVLRRKWLNFHFQNEAGGFLNIYTYACISLY